MNNRTPGVHLIALLVVLCSLATGIGCRKVADSFTPTLTADKAALQLTGESGYLDSFTVTANTNWAITVSPAADWLELDQTSGSGNTVVHVRNTKENGGIETAEVTLTLYAIDEAIPSTLIKVSQRPYLNKLFSKMFGGDGEEAFVSAIGTTDGGIMLAGWTSSNKNGDVSGESRGGRDYWVVKMDKTGTIQWNVVLGSSDWDLPSQIIATKDGNYLVAGFAGGNDLDVTGNAGRDDAWIVKLDGAGNVLWKKTYGNDWFDNAFGITATSDGGAVFTGYYLPNYGHEQVWALRIDKDGAVVWDKKYGGSGGEWGTSVLETEDGGFLLSATTESSDGEVKGFKGASDVWLLKLDSGGDIEWSKTYGGSQYDFAGNMVLAPDGNYVLSLSTYSSDGDVPANHGKIDGWFLKISKTGEVLWSKVFGGSGEDYLGTPCFTPQGQILIPVQTTSADCDFPGNKGSWDAILLKLSANGDKRWIKSFGSNNIDIATQVLPVGDGAFIMTGYSGSNDGEFTGNHGDADAWLLKFN